MSADQYHVIILRAQVLKLTADQVPAFLFDRGLKPG